MWNSEADVGPVSVFRYGSGISVPEGEELSFTVVAFTNPKNFMVAPLPSLTSGMTLWASMGSTGNKRIGVMAGITVGPAGAEVAGGADTGTDVGVLGAIGNDVVPGLVEASKTGSGLTPRTPAASSFVNTPLATSN